MNDDDARRYLARYPDLQAAFGSDLGAAKRHWENNGQREGRSYAAIDMNDAEAADYLARYPDLRAAFGGNVEKAKQHWLEFGQREGRSFTKLPAPSQLVAAAKALTRIPISTDKLLLVNPPALNQSEPTVFAGGTPNFDMTGSATLIAPGVVETTAAVGSPGDYTKAKKGLLFVGVVGAAALLIRKLRKA